MADKKEINMKDELNKYQFAALAAGLSESKERMPYVIEAMSNFYEKSLGLKDDPIITQALSEASYGIQSGHISSQALLGAMSYYAKKFEKAQKEAKVSEFIEYAGVEIPDKVKQLLEKYADTKIGELKKDDEEHKLVSATLGVLRNNVMEGNLYSKLVKENTKKTLKSLEDKLSE